jgi:hypothetical protein
MASAGGTSSITGTLAAGELSLWDRALPGIKRGEKKLMKKGNNSQKHPFRPNISYTSFVYPDWLLLIFLQCSGRKSVNAGDRIR